jgi:hypothetical protein
MPTHFSDRIEMGLSPVKPDYRPAKETALPTVMLMSRRAGCLETGPSSSREASESNPRSPTGSNLQILSHALERARMRASGKNSDVKLGRDV